MRDTDHPKTPGQAVEYEMANQIGDATAIWPWNVDAIAQAAIQASGLVEALEELTAIVRGECPRILNEDSGGHPDLSLRIDDVLAKLKGQS
jgi:hypothetical protein